MAPPELAPFADEHVEAAAGLLAVRQARSRAAEPALPEVDYAAEIRALWAKDGASGAVALRGGRVVGYLLGTRLADDVWGPNAWVELAGHAAEEAEDVRDLHAFAARRWIEEGRRAQYAYVPAAEPELIDAWFQAGFGRQHILALREVPEASPVEPPPGVTIRRPTADDAESAHELSYALARHQALSPVFAPLPDPDPDSDRREWVEDVVGGEHGDFVAERDGLLVGFFAAVPVELSGAHSGLARPAKACILGYAVTLPEARGAGIGRALMNTVFSWAREQAYATIVTDWRTTNLLSSRVWPRYGFRPTFVRLHRYVA